MSVSPPIISLHFSSADLHHGIYGLFHVLVNVFGAKHAGAVQAFLLAMPTSLSELLSTQRQIVQAAAAQNRNQELEVRIKLVNQRYQGSWV